MKEEISEEGEKREGPFAHKFTNIKRTRYGAFTYADLELEDGAKAEFGIDTFEEPEDDGDMDIWMEKTKVETKDDYYIFSVNPDDRFTINEMEGIGGAAFFGHQIFLMLDSSFTEESLKYIVAYEYNHTVHMSHNGYNSTSRLIDGVITEGKADVFAEEIFPDMKAPWINSLTNDEETAVVGKLHEGAYSIKRDDYEELLHGKSSESIPIWANYKIGYQIMKSFIENNPDVSIDEWTVMDAEEIVEQSDYREIVE